MKVKSIINWVLFSEETPPDIVECYLTCDTYGDVCILEWYEGEGFECCNDGHWNDVDGHEITNIVYWAKIPILIKNKS